MLRKMQKFCSCSSNEPSPFLETTVLNAGLGFYANGKVASIRRSCLARQGVIASGKALKKTWIVTGVPKMSQEFF